MRYVVIVFLLAGFFISVVPASASSTFEQGYYNFEDTIAGMTYTGSWSTVNHASVMSRQTLSGVSNVSFGVDGKTLIIWRMMRPGSGNSFLVCVNNTSCITVNCDTSAAGLFWYPFAITLPGGAVLITIHWVSGGVNLDAFMVLDDPNTTGGMPTAVPTVPTATIIPSSTPAFTATPAYTATPGPTPVHTATAVPTATPQPTATPYTVPDAFYAIDPAARYDTVNGQITVTRYEMRASDYMDQFLMGVLVIVNLVAVGLTIWKRK